MHDLDSVLIETALRKMVDRGYFDICTIDNILKVTGNIPNREAMKRLQLLHCVHYSDMPQPVLDGLPDLIRDALNGPTFNVDALFIKKEPTLISASPKDNKFIRLFKPKA